MERISATELLLHFRDDGSCTVASLNAPETWSALPRSKELCSRFVDGWEGPVLNDQLAASHYAASPPGCQVQHRIALPQRPTRPDDATDHQEAGIVALKPTPHAIRLLVHGATLAASFAMENGYGVQTVSAPTFAMALPPERIKLELVRVDGQTFWEVQLDLDIPYNPSPACILGHLIFETATSLEDPAQRAILRQYEEFGRCE